MSLEKSNNKGKAVVKEEVSPLPPVEEQKPFAVKDEEVEVSLPAPILGTAAPPPPHHQTPPSDTISDTSDDDTETDVDLGGSFSGVPDVGSSAASASATAAHMMQQVAMQRGLVVVPTVIPPAFQHLDRTRILVIKGVMQQCVAALAAGDVLAANAGLVAMSTLASPGGDPLKRVAFAFAEALGRRALQHTLPGLYGGLLRLDFPPRPPGPGHTGCSRICFDALSPFLRVAASAANQAILTAMASEERVHVIDLGGANPNQWLDLLHLLAQRPEGAPSSLRLTVVSEEEGLLNSIAWLLHREAARLHIAFVFNPVRSHIDRLSPQNVASFGVHPGEALAISSTLQLHRLIADVTTIDLPAAVGEHHGKKGKGEKQPNKQQVAMVDALLRVLCDLSPKVMILTEQEGNHNGASLGERVINAFDYYMALFNDLEAGGATRMSAHRAAVERILLRDEIMDLVAQDGSSRRERHENMMSWALRMGKAGFWPVTTPVRRFDAFADPGLLAQQLSFHGTLRYWVAQDNSCFVIYANMTPLFSVTAWRPAPSTGA